MTSPCSSSSASSSPYNPLSSTSRSQSTTPTPLDDEQPCCSRSLIATASSSSAVAATAEKTKRASKRKIDETSSSNVEETAGTQPRKRSRKTHNIKTTPPSSPRPKRKRALRAHLTTPLKEKPWQLANRYRSKKYQAAKDKINEKYLKQLQQELHLAMSRLDGDDRAAAAVWDGIAQTMPSTRKWDPIILFKRLLKPYSRLHWKKLTKALSYLTATTSHGPDRLGPIVAQQATRWLSMFFNSLHPESRPRNLIFGSTFTHLCGQALAAQQVELTPTNSTSLTHHENLACFLTMDDFHDALDNPDIMETEQAVVFLRDYDAPRNRTENTSSRNYPLKDFEEGQQ